MELKEIWGDAADFFVMEMLALDPYKTQSRKDFLAGCYFEHNRSHWFDPEKELPPYDIHNGSIVVLVKKKDGTIQSGYYDFLFKVWAFQGVDITNVISWAYIPN